MRSSAPEDTVPAAFRAHFAAHNARVIGLALLSVIVVALAWVLAYGVTVWLTLLAATVAHGVEAQAPRHLLWQFCASALLLVAMVCAAYRLDPHPRLADRRRWWEHVVDVVLALPRATVSIWSTLRAYQFLDERELRLAWGLLQRVGREQRMSLQEVPQEIPDARDRDRVLLAVQLVDLADFLRIGGVTYLQLRDAKARELCAPRTRLRLR